MLGWIKECLISEILQTSFKTFQENLKPKKTMKIQRLTPMGDTTMVSANSLTNHLMSVIKGSFLMIVLFMAASSANAQSTQTSFIRFVLTQGRITVPVNSINSTVITNNVNLSGGCTNANFDVSGLPPGATAVLTDTNGNALVSTTRDTNLWLTINTANIPEGLYNFRLNAGGFDTNGLPVTNSIPFVLQAAHIWNGSLNTSNGWSDASSWLGGLPGASDDVVFADQGAQTNNFLATTGQSFTNSFVTVNTTVASLRFAQTGMTNSIATNPPPIFHHIQISPATILTISGTNGFSLMRDYFDDANAGLGTMNVTIDGGVGSRLVVSNQNANVAIFAGGSLNPTLNLSNLENFVVNVGRVGIADYLIYPNYRDLNTGLNVGRDTNSYVGRPRQMSANIFLAKTNIFTASFVDPQNYTNEFSRGYAFTLFNNEQNGVGSGVSQSFLLGITNIFMVDGICFFDANGNGTVKFNPTNGVARFRGTNGTSRMSVFTVSDDGGTNQAASNLKGTVDFSAGTVDILADRLYLSRDRELIQTNQTPNVQSDLTIGKGIVDVNTAILGFQEHTKPDWTAIGGGTTQPYLNYCQGRLVVTNGGTFRVNGTLTLGYTADTNSSANAQQYGTYGQITIYSNSLVTSSNVVVDGGLNFYDSNLHLPGLTPRANTITINQGGNLIVTNGIGANNYADNNSLPFANSGLPGLPLDTLTMGQSSILTLFVSPGKTNVYVRNFVSTGATPGTIKIASLPTFSSFPTNIPLIAYSTAAPFLQADMSAIGGTVQGYILNDSAAQTIDLFLTTNAPKTLIWTGNTDNNWDLTTLNWKTTSGAPTNFSLGDIVTFDDSSSVTNINIPIAIVPNQATNGVVIANSAHIYTFTTTGGGIVGTAKILKQGTNTVIFNTAESGPISITAGEVDVAGSGILGATTLFSNSVLNILGGGNINGSLTSTGAVAVASGGNINGGVVLGGGSFVNDGTVSVGSGAFTLNNSAVATNNSDGTIVLGTATGGGAAGYEVFAGTTLANFGVIEAPGGRLLLDGLYFGTGQFFDNVNPASSSSLARFQMDSTTTALLSPGATPNNSIGNILMGARLDMHQSGPNNNVGKFLVEVDQANNINDTITATKWNNIGCVWVMTNLNGSFSSGQSFRVLVNQNGINVTNLIDTSTIFPLMSPPVPGPGLQWNISGVQMFGTVGVTNSTMVWDGSGNDSWDTNNSSGNWKNSQTFGNNQGAIFDDSASGSTSVNLTTTVAPAGFNVVTVTNIVTGVSTNIVSTTNAPAFMPGIVVSNAVNNYTISGTGKITGMTSIYKTGPGTLTLLTSNDFTGGVIVDGGTFAMTNVTAIGVNVNQVYNELLIDNNAIIQYLGTTNQSLGHFVTINQNGATFQVASNAEQLTLGQNILGSGALTKTGSGMLVLTQTGDAYNGTIVNEGTLRLTTAAAGPGSMTLANNATLQLTNGVGGTATGITLTNVINITGAGTAINILGVSTNIFGGAWIGNGTATITTTNAANLFVFNADLSGFSGTVSFGTSSNIFRFNNATNKNPCIGSAAATFDLGTGSATLNNFNGSNLVYNLGALAGGPNTTLSGSVTNIEPPGTTYSVGANGGSTTFSGKIANGLDTVSIVKVGSGSLLLNGNSTFTGSTTVSNGVLGGSGSIAGPLIVTAGGILSPGATIGTFTVNNNATLGGTTLMELNTASSPAVNDKLVVTGTIIATGALTVTNVGPDIVNGTTFQLFNQGVTGFSSVVLPPKDPTGTKTYSWANNLSANGTIQLTSGGVTNPVNPNPTNIVVSVSGNTMTLSWPQDHIGWSLQAQTNPLSVGLWTNWFIVAGSSITNQVSVQMNPTNGAVFYRLILP
jgi:autotransporter-associated beta strand protein